MFNEKAVIFVHMTILTVHINDEKSEKAVRAFFDALGLPYREEKARGKNPSPSGDAWFLDEKNLAEIDKGIAEVKAGKSVSYTPEIKKELFGQ